MPTKDASGSATLTPIQAGELLAVSPSSVRRWIHDGSLEAVKVGGRYRIGEKAIRRMVSPAREAYVTQEIT